MPPFLLVEELSLFEPLLELLLELLPVFELFSMSPFFISSFFVVAIVLGF